MEATKNSMLLVLSQKLSELRTVDRRKFSLRSIALRINVSHSMLSQILKGKKAPSPLLLRRLCDDFSMTEVQKLQALNDLISMGAKAKKYLSSEDYQGYILANNTGTAKHHKAIQLSESVNSEELTKIIKNYVDEILTLAHSQEHPQKTRLVLSFENSPSENE